MNFLRLHDNLLSILFEDDEIIAIDKPYGFDAHTNDSKSQHGEAIKDGLIEIYSKNRQQELHIIHRLDKTTTGVMIFGKSQDSAKKYKEFFSNRQVHKEYWFVTQNEVKKKHYLIDKPIVHKAKELEAKTEMTWVRSQNQFHLWKAHPHTGRNHQIRIHAQVAGISLLGDEKYGGTRFAFLCLHNHQMQFPNGLKIQSHMPAYFQNLDLLSNHQLVRVIFEVDRRQRLFALESLSLQCLRLVNQVGGENDQSYNLDQLGNQWILYWLKEEWTPEDETRWNMVAEYFKRNIILHHKEKRNILGPSSGAAATWVVQEANAKFEIHAQATGSCGLYLNQRLHRHWLSQNVHGKRVLNVFAYTGSYGVTAALGGASKVTLVDSNKNYLAWAKRNFEINGLETLKDLLFLCRDSLTFLEGAVAKKQAYDVIICEVPTFFRREKGIFKIEKDFEALLSLCLKALSSDGVLLLSVSFDGFFIDDLRRKILSIQKKLDLNLILPSLDFEWPDQKPGLKSFLIRRNPS